jgi:hypothetical protein
VLVIKCHTQQRAMACNASSSSSSSSSGGSMVGLVQEVL